MKIVIVGANGAAGHIARETLGHRHDIISVGRSRGDIRADAADRNSIREMYRRAGSPDAVVCAIGGVEFQPVQQMTGIQFMRCLQSKVLPQINLVLEGVQCLNEGGSFTLTSGVSNRDPVRGGAAAAAANGALDAFVVGAAVDMPRGIRINAVSPEPLEVSRLKHPGRFPGHTHVSDAAVGRAYRKSVEGCLTGQVFIVE